MSVKDKNQHTPVELDIYQVDAFAYKVFGGNPAAVVPMKEWLPDAMLQSIALENNLPETAFFVEQGNHYRLRWFTPETEMDLCGHATLATAWVIFNQLGYGQDTIRFESKSGDLFVHRNGSMITLDFPALPSDKGAIDPRLEQAFGHLPTEYYLGAKNVAFYDNADFIATVRPDLSLIKTMTKEGIVITAPGYDDYDFVSRYFAPQIGIDEDPVTGAAHCRIAPLWSQKLGKTIMKARQISARGGDVLCEVRGDRVMLSGTATLYMKGVIYV